MFGFAKKKKLDLLYKDNIKTGCSNLSKEDAIKEIGNMLVNTGYVKKSYIDGMLQREKTFSTYMGNFLALPHGVEEAKKEILSSGIAVMVFPEGIDWNGETAKIVIGIAGVGEEHLDILSKVADKILDESTMNIIISGNSDDIYKILN